ncbi:MAG TPA: hypothetical protein VIV58_11490 [Kofleriaceae bacterium]
MPTTMPERVTYADVAPCSSCGSRACALAQVAGQDGCRHGEHRRITPTREPVTYGTTEPCPSCGSVACAMNQAAGDRRGCRHGERNDVARVLATSELADDPSVGPDEEDVGLDIINPPSAPAGPVVKIRKKTT